MVRETGSIPLSYGILHLILCQHKHGIAKRQMNSDPYTNKFAKITLSSEEKIESKSQSRTF